jgi:hypothetical protein
MSKRISLKHQSNDYSNTFDFKSLGYQFHYLLVEVNQDTQVENIVTPSWIYLKVYNNINICSLIGIPPPSLYTINQKIFFRVKLQVFYQNL